jgi:hypothetical protein
MTVYEIPWPISGTLFRAVRGRAAPVSESQLASRGNGMAESVPTRPCVARAVRLLANPRSSAADTGLVTAVALRLAALDCSGDTATRLVEASDQVVGTVAEVLGSKGGSREWSDTADGIALLLADRSVTRRHLVAGKVSLGSGDKLVDLADRLRSILDDAVQSDDLARALATAVTGSMELLSTAANSAAAGRRDRNDSADHPEDGGLPAPIPLRRP